jgi:hypothetical protein
MATIYKLQPKIPCDGAKIYIGSTTLKLGQRFSTHKYHFNAFNMGKYNKKCTSRKLFEEYGIDGVEIVEIEKCELENRTEREAYWIGYYNGVNQVKYTFNPTEYKKDWYEKNKKRISDESKQKYLEKKKNRDFK